MLQKIMADDSPESYLVLEQRAGRFLRSSFRHLVIAVPSLRIGLDLRWCGGSVRVLDFAE